MGMSFVTKLNFWQRKRYRIQLDSFLYLSWFTATINTTVCLSSLFSTNLERPYYELDPVNAMFLNCLCSSIFLENSRVYSPFLFTDCLQWSSIPMILGFVFLNIALIQDDRSMCVSLRSKQRYQKQRLVCSVSILIILSVETDKSNC